MNSLEEIKRVIKEEILVKRLELEDITAAEIEDDLPLFGPVGLGLDSVEALDILAGLEQVFGIRLQGISEEEFRECLQSVDSLAAFVSERRKED